MPAVCRGDSVDCDVVHCSKPQRAQRSDNVKVNGIGISRQATIILHIYYQHQFVRHMQLQ